MDAVYLMDGLGSRASTRTAGSPSVSISLTASGVRAVYLTKRSDGILDRALGKTAGSPSVSTVRQSGLANSGPREQRAVGYLDRVRAVGPRRGQRAVHLTKRSDEILDRALGKTAGSPSVSTVRQSGWSRTIEKLPTFFSGRAQIRYTVNQ